MEHMTVSLRFSSWAPVEKLDYHYRISGAVPRGVEGLVMKCGVGLAHSK